MTSNTMLVVHERANGVVVNNKFYPYRMVRSSLSIIRKNVRIYVKSVSYSGIQEGIVSRGSIYATGIMDGTSVILGSLDMAAQTAGTDYFSAHNIVQVGLLLDRERGVTITSSLSSGYAYITYSEIDDV